MQLKKYPVILFTILFITGIASGKFLQLPVIVLGFYLLILVLVYTVYLLSGRNMTVKSILSYVLYSGVVLTGIFYYTPARDFIFKDKLNREEVILIGKITNINISGKDEIRFTARSDSILYKDSVITYAGEFICVLRNDSGRTELYPGYNISFKGIYIAGRNVRNPGEFNYKEYLQNTGISGNIYSYYPDDLKVLLEKESFFPAVTYKIRKYISGQLDFYFNENTAALLRGILLAERKDIDQDIKTNFINSGTAHILAVSGLHVGYIVLIFLFLFGRLNLYLKSLFTILGIAAFVVITGAPDSVVRASVMAVILIVAFISNRSTNIFNSLAISAMVILLFKPGDLFLPGFQLSYAAVISIGFMYPFIKDRINTLNISNKVIINILLLISVTLVAQLGTLPFVLHYFSKLSIISIVTNLVIIPAVGLLIGASFFVIAVAPLSTTVAIILASSADLISDLVFYFSEISGNQAFSYIPVNDFSIQDIIIFYTVLLFFFIFVTKMDSLFKKAVLTVLSLFLIISLAEIDNKIILKENILSCYVIDVGQGDAILLKFPGGKTGLIDAGEARINYDTGERIIEPLLNYLNIRQIDYTFITHMDSDHYSGIVHLIHKGYVKYLYKPSPDTTSKEKKFENFLKTNNVSYTYYNGNMISLEGTRIYILDNGTIKDRRFTDNDCSAVIMLKYGDTSLLFTGDAGFRAEDYYINKYENFLRTDALKISHHGSSSATSREFLYITKPSIALISVGEKNKYGHPSEEVLRNLENIGAEVYRTDLHGGILLQSDGYSLKTINWKEM